MLPVERTILLELKLTLNVLSILLSSIVLSIALGAHKRYLLDISLLLSGHLITPIATYAMQVAQDASNRLAPAPHQ